MASILNATTTAGVTVTGDNSGSLQLATNNGTTAVTIDTSQKVGVGATPYTWWAASKALQVGTTTAFEDLSAGTTIFNNSYRDAGGSSVYATTAAASRYVFSGNQHSLQGAASGTANTAVSWSPLIAVELGKSVALQGASSQTGTGITFPATQSASSDANTLDDYEEGTWTPSVGGNATYTAQTATYTKIGRVVTVNAILIINTIGTGSPNVITGLPFATTSNNQGSVSVFSSLSTALVFCVPYTDTNNTTSVLWRTLTGANTSNGTNNIFQNGSRVDFTMTYFAS